MECDDSAKDDEVLLQQIEDAKDSVANWMGNLAICSINEFGCYFFAVSSVRCCCFYSCMCMCAGTSSSFVTLKVHTSTKLVELYDHTNHVSMLLCV